MDTPLHIPNREVKHAYADGTLKKGRVGIAFKRSFLFNLKTKFMKKII